MHGQPARPEHILVGERERQNAARCGVIEAREALPQIGLQHVIIDPSDDPLSAMFLAIAGLPWTLALGWLIDRTGELPVWFNLVLLSAGILANYRQRAIAFYGFAPSGS